MVTLPSTKCRTRLGTFLRSNDGIDEYISLRSKAWDSVEIEFYVQLFQGVISVRPSQQSAYILSGSIAPCKSYIFSWAYVFQLKSWNG